MGNDKLIFSTGCGKIKEAACAAILNAADLAIKNHNAG
jgi:hypothetical protein